MRLTSWDLVASFVIGAAAASVGWGVWLLVRRDRPTAPAPAAPPARRADPPPLRSPLPEPPATPRRRPAGAVGELRTSQRVILHLARQPRLGYGDVAPRTITQAGITEVLGVPQPALTKVLGRLVDGGAVLAIRTHVSGASRRLKVYQLTAHGEAIARDLRRRGPPTDLAARTAPAAASETPARAGARAAASELVRGPGPDAPSSAET